MRCLASLLYFAIVALCIFGADNAFALATPASGLRPAIEGSLSGGAGGGGGGAEVVSSFEAMDTYLRTLDLSASATSPNIAAHVVLSDDFTWDTTRTTPYVIQLPVGGPDHSQFVIDLNGKQIYTASKTGVLAFDFHDGTTSVAHDYDFHLRNGMITSTHPDNIADGGAVDCAGNAPTYPPACDRKLVTMDFTNAAGGRVSFADLKLGGMVDDVVGGFDISWSFPYAGDACITMDGGTLPQRINIRDSNFECNAGLRIDSGLTSGMRIQTSNVEYLLLPLITTFSGNVCTNCAIIVGQEGLTGGGFFRIDVDMEDSFISGDLQFPVNGKLGHFSGGILNLDVTGKWAPTCTVLAQAGLNTFLDNEALGDASPSISGSVDFVGEYCSKTWVRSAAYGALNMTATLTGGLPLLMTDDTTWSRLPGDAVTSAVVDGPGAGSTFTSGVDVHFTFDTPITTDPAVTHDCATGDAWGCYFTNEQDAGSVFDNDYEYVKVRFGANGSRVEYGAGTDSITAGPLH